MITRFFKTNQPVVYLAIVMLALVFWSAGILKGFSVITSANMPFYGLFFYLIHPDVTWAYSLMGLLLIVSQAIHLNWVMNRHEVLFKNSFLPALMYVLFSCCIPPFVSFHPVLVINTILIFVIDKMFSLFKNESPLAPEYDACFLISISTLFYFPAIAFMLFFMAGLLILRPFSWRDWMVGVLGFLTPIFFVLVYYFLTDNLELFRQMAFSSGITKEFNLKNAIPPGYLLTLSCIIVLSFLSFWKIRENFYKNVARTRNFQQLIFLLIIIGISVIIVTPGSSIYRFSILSIPVSTLLAYYFLVAKKTWIADGLIYIFLLVIIYNFIMA